jgi:hypothetical protein
MLPPKPSTTPSRGATAPKVVKPSVGAPANEAVTGRLRSAYSWLQPSRSMRFSFSRHGASIPAPSCVPSTVRSDCVI